MKNRVFLILTLSIVLLAGIFAFLMWFFNNPNDEQYVAYRQLNTANSKYQELVYKNNNLEAYYKLADKPLINQHNLNFLLAMNYAEAGKYDDALRVLDAYNPDKIHYGECWAAVSPKFNGAFAASLQRFACRTIIHSRIPELLFQARDYKRIFLANIYYYVYYNKGDFKKALEYIVKADTNFCGQAKAYAADGNIKKAEELYADCSNNYSQFLIKGIISTKQGDFAAAEDYFKKAIELAPNIDEAYIEMAEMYKQSGQISLSRQFAQKALNLKPYSAKAKSYLAK